MDDRPRHGGNVSIPDYRTAKEDNGGSGLCRL